MKTRKLIIVGDSAFAEIAHEYFQDDSQYEVVGFSVEKPFIKKEKFRGLPLVALEELASAFDPSTHYVFVAIAYAQLNRLRSRLLESAESMGFKAASYVSSRAFVWKNAEIGEHCFVFEDNTIQPFVKIERNVILWSGNHVGHHSIVRKNCFIASHAVISGYCDIGENTFIGVNATLANNVTIGKDNWLGPNVVIMKDTQSGALFKTESAEPAKISAPRFFRVSE